MGGRHKMKGDVYTHIAASCCCKAETDQHCKAIMCCVLRLVTQSCLTLCDPIDDCLPGFSVHGDSPGKNTGVGCHALLQRIFPTQGLNPGLPHCKQILYHLSQLYSKLKKKKLRPTSLGRSCDFTHLISLLLLCSYYILCTAKAIWGIQKKFHQSSHSLFISLLIHSEMVLNTYWLPAQL